MEKVLKPPEKVYVVPPLKWNFLWKLLWNQAPHT